MTTYPAEVVLRIPPQQAGEIVDDLGRRLPAHPFTVGPLTAVKHGMGFYIDPGANPVHITISDGTGIDGQVSVMAIPGGAVMRLVNPGHAELAPYWLALLDELRRLGCIEGEAPGGIDGGEEKPEPKRKGRGTSSQTDANAREAERLYNSGLMTEAEIAERKAVSVKTVQRWRKRANTLRKTQKGTHNG